VEPTFIHGNVTILARTDQYVHPLLQTHY
jgi:hypothetical protein